MDKFCCKAVLKGIIGIHILVILVLFLYCFHGISNIEPQTLPAEKFFLLSGNYDEERRISRIDERSGQTGIFSCGPYMQMEKGIYTATVFYDTDSAGQYIYAFSESDEYCRKLLRSDKVMLDPNMSQKTFHFWLNKGISDFEFRTEWGGVWLS